MQHHGPLFQLGNRVSFPLLDYPSDLEDDPRVEVKQWN
jgi:hypothetical protein